MNDPFGFSSVQKPKPADLASKLATMKQSPLPPEMPTEAIDQVAERRGFTSREPGEVGLENQPPQATPEPGRGADPEPRPASTAKAPKSGRGASWPRLPALGNRRRGEIGPSLAINTRVPLRIAEPFIAWCDENRYSYWQGIEELMRRAGILK